MPSSCCPPTCGQYDRQCTDAMIANAENAILRDRSQRREKELEYPRSRQKRLVPLRVVQSVLDREQPGGKGDNEDQRYYRQNNEAQRSVLQPVQNESVGLQGYEQTETKASRIESADSGNLVRVLPSKPGKHEKACP